MRRAVLVTKLQRARVLLAVDQGIAGSARTDAQVVDGAGGDGADLPACAVDHGTVMALERKPRPFPPVPKKLDGEKEAHLVQVACSVPPEGCVRWTVKMLAEELIRLEVVDRFARRLCGGR